jgi:hypothetical protein
MARSRQESQVKISRVDPINNAINDRQDETKGRRNNTAKTREDFASSADKQQGRGNVENTMFRHV